MEDYLNKGKEILKILINNGYEAYFIGGVVRNTILTIPFDEIEINTSATPDAIKGIFEFTKVEEFTIGTIKLMYFGYIFYVSTFRAEGKDRKAPAKFHYSKNLLDDLASRDFTINAIAMSHSGKITDAYNGYEDLRKKCITSISKPTISFSEDPVRMLRAIRFVSELNFKIKSATKKAIRKRAKCLATIEIKVIAHEIKKLLEGKYYRKALELLINSRLYKYIPILNKAFKFQERKFVKLTCEEFLLVAFYLNNGIDENYLQIVEDKVKFKKVFQLAIANPKCEYSSLDLFSNGEEVCITANYINFVLRHAKKKSKKIAIAYRELPIHQVCDIQFKGEDIMQLTGNQDAEYLNSLLDAIILAILNHELRNEYDAIKVFVINLLKTEPANKPAEETPIKEVLNNETTKNDEVVINNPNNQVIKDYTGYRIDMLEKRLNEQDRIIKETKTKMAQDEIDMIVKKNLELLALCKYLDNPNKDKVDLSRQIRKVYMNFISDGDTYQTTEVNNEKD